MPDLCDVVGEREFEARPFQLDNWSDMQCY